MTDKNLKKFSYAVLIVPSVLIYASVIVIPIIYSLVLSFTEWTGYGTPKFVGLSQYIKMIVDPRFLHGLRNNILVVGISIFGQIPLGFVLAYIIYRKLVKAVNFFETMIFLPITISSVVVAILFRVIFFRTGNIYSICPYFKR